MAIRKHEINAVLEPSCVSADIVADNDEQKYVSDIQAKIDAKHLDIFEHDMAEVEVFEKSSWSKRTNK